MKRSGRSFLRHSLNRKRLLQIVFSIFRLVLLIGLAFMIVYPLIVKFSASIKSPADQANPSVMFIPK